MIPPKKQLVVGFQTGFETYEKPFLLDNDAFPTLQNAYIFRKRIEKKPGAYQLGRAKRQIETTDGSGNATITIDPSPAPTTLSSGIISFSVGSQFFIDGGGASPVTLTTVGAGTAILNRTTTVLTITGTAINTAVYYYPSLPGMGIESFESDDSESVPIDLPVNVFFDQKYAYQFNSTSLSFYDVSFYKSTANPIIWSGSDHQQFFSQNYFRVMFSSNDNPGAFNFAITSISNAGTPVVTVTLPTGCSDMQLQTGDYVFINECAGASANLVNMLAFKITRTGANTFTISGTGGTLTITNATGCVFPLTRRILPDNSGGTFSGQVGDSITWYDGDPSGASGLGFVNFVPPLDNLESSATTYLIGCRILISFGNRLLAIGTYEATSAQIQSGSTGTYYGNRIRYSQLSPGTPFYTQGDTDANTLIPTTLPRPTFTGTPSTDSANAVIANSSWISNVQGFGGFVDLDVTDRIISAALTQGSMVLGLETEQRRVSLTGIETNPFTIQVINPEYGTAGTHAIVPMDKGILTVGEYGILITSTYDAKRFDEKIIDQIFEVQNNNSGYDRICGARDFPNELIYFTYNDVDASNVFPNRTIVFNYRDGSFALWIESYTTYGIFKFQGGTPWEKLTQFTWENWKTPWESGAYSEAYPYVAGFTPQGYVMLKNYDSGNSASLCIQKISGNQITSPNHMLEPGMYISFQALGANTPSGSYQVNSIVDTNNFTVQGDISSITVPGYEMVILDNFLIQTKQFQVAWPDAMKTRIGTQRYFLDKTTDGEFTVDLLASQSPIPINNPSFDSAISSNIVRTRPDDSLGLNDAQSQQTQIWHRLATSVLGDTVQMQFRLSDAQMATVNAETKVPTVAAEPWVLHAFVVDLYPSRILA